MSFTKTTVERSLEKFLENTQRKAYSCLKHLNLIPENLEKFSRAQVEKTSRKNRTTLGLCPCLPHKDERAFLVRQGWGTRELEMS